MVRSVIVALAVICVGWTSMHCRREPNHVESLIDEAEHGTSVKHRQEACIQLGRTAGAMASKALIRFLDDQVLWHCAAQALGERHDAHAIPALAQRLDVRDPHTYKFVWALGEIGDPRARIPLDGLARQLDIDHIEDTRIEEELRVAFGKLDAAALHN